MQNLSAFIASFSVELNKQCCALDPTWICRRRIFTSKTVFISIFFMIMDRASNFKSLSDLIRLNAAPFNLNLPKYSPSSFSAVRKKFSPYIFVDFSQWIYRFVAEKHQNVRWFARSIFAIDSTTITLPRELKLVGFGYDETHDFYPNGLLTTLYDLQLGLTYDSIFSQHRDERGNAMELMKGIPEGSILIGDRGFFSFEMLYHARNHKIDVLFRIDFAHAPEEIQELRGKEFIEESLIIYPSIPIERRLIYLGIKPAPIHVRLFRAKIKGNEYLLVTTVLDERIRRKDFLKLYESRWDIEESYKLLKAELQMQKFKSKHLNGILQEIFATVLLANISQAVMTLQLGPRTKTIVRTVTSVLTITRIIRNSFFALLSGTKKMKKRIGEMISRAIERSGSSFRPGRHYPRNFYREVSPWGRYEKGIRR